ncbi:MAG TPA: MBL fold metallo-hydrolase [Thermoleophilaceae bacterium]|nr:MBL fold metallo-hydrolase [Thermoleophilaceae bacterium]
MTRILFVGHATTLVEIAGTRFLTDPLLRSRVAHLRRIVPFPAGCRVTDPDAVLISHAHLDHLDLPSLRRLSPSARVVLPRGRAALARRAGLHEVIEVEAGDRVRIGRTDVLATPARHSGRRFPLGRATQALGYLMEDPQRVYFAGDTDIFDGMRDLAGQLDLALLPVSGWGRRLPSGHLDPERAARAAALLRPRYAVPIHWGTHLAPRARPSSSERPAHEFARLTSSRAPDVEVRVLRPGEDLSIEERPAHHTGGASGGQQPED